MAKSESGFTLVEVVVAILLAAVIVGSVFSLALTIKKGNVRTDRDLNANQYARELSSLLKSYVTGDCGSNTVNGIAAPNGSWSLTGAVPDPNNSAKKIVDSCGACYALAPGTHILTNFLPDALANAPYNGQASYTVAYSGWASPTPPCQMSPPQLAAPPSISISITWTEPKP